MCYVRDRCLPARQGLSACTGSATLVTGTLLTSKASDTRFDPLCWIDSRLDRATVVKALWRGYLVIRQVIDQSVTAV